MIGYVPMCASVSVYVCARVCTICDHIRMCVWTGLVIMNFQNTSWRLESKCQWPLIRISYPIRIFYQTYYILVWTCFFFVFFSSCVFEWDIFLIQTKCNKNKSYRKTTIRLRQKLGLPPVVFLLWKYVFSFKYLAPRKVHPGTLL